MNRLRDNFKDIDFEPKNVKQIFFQKIGTAKHIIPF